jgi:acetyltransferase-like isoleucine patch superfamily enzyme
MLLMFSSILEKLYRSPFGRIMSWVARMLSGLKKPYMIYGVYDSNSQTFRKYTRLSDSVVILNKLNLSIGDNVWVWHYSILDATEGLTIEDGCQIGAWVGIFTHASHISIRLYGEEYINVPYKERIGYTRGAVKIGAYTFVGAKALILPGITIGKGCIIGAGSIVNKNIPDCSIAMGNPVKVIGNTKDLDESFLNNKNLIHTYYDKNILSEMMERKKGIFEISDKC